MKLEDAIAHLDAGDAADLVKIIAIINTPARQDRYLSLVDGRIVFSEDEDGAVEVILEGEGLQEYFNMLADGEEPITCPVEQAQWLFDCVHERGEDDEETNDGEEYNDHILEQQELEDFEHADEYYGGCCDE